MSCVLLYNNNSKYKFFYHLEEGDLFIINSEFLKYLRTKNQKKDYYKYGIKELITMTEDQLPILMYITKQFYNNSLEYVFLHGKELLFLFEEDFETLNDIKVKIISTKY